MSDLFRREVMEERKVAGLGNVSVMAPPSFAILTAGICAAITALVLFVCLAQFTRKATVAGYLVPDKGLVKVLPPFPGTVVERLVTEGDPVATGDLLYVVVAHRATAETPDVDAALIARVRDQRQAMLEQLEQARRVSDLEIQMLGREATGLRDELGQAHAELDAQKKRLAIGNGQIEKHRALVSQGHLPAQQVLDQEREQLALAALISGLERTRMNLARQIDSVHSRIEILTTERAAKAADYRQRISEAEQRLAELEARAGYAVRA